MFTFIQFHTHPTTKIGNREARHGGKVVLLYPEITSKKKFTVSLAGKKDILEFQTVFGFSQHGIPFSQGILKGKNHGFQTYIIYITTFQISSILFFV